MTEHYWGSLMVMTMLSLEEREEVWGGDKKAPFLLRSHFRKKMLLQYWRLLDNFFFLPIQYPLS